MNGLPNVVDKEEIKRCALWESRWVDFLGLYGDVTCKLPLIIDRRWLASVMAKQTLEWLNDDEKQR